ncbi:aminodeoxychorismate synthase, subunit II [Candidatus Terasakiella magnetica]|uniref:Aminodeoxychorismate synthase, subunit II n=1 Tax=Candidatus Terasakiella magnetica TaxID=1867952 RepID=A0A1C3RLM4_9PROT|nr:aminodeoxychorismate/anthranilate synthase component II [Candidatus Terasakiella magnetica]SCA58167.1 aminodeoxychorismate synthase, subunit II [Candidatus Terasakiella magnetica]
MILLIDNYDSFVYNLARYLEELYYDTKVVRNDEITLEEIITLNPQAIILSPGPCGPDKAGICLELVEHLGGKTPILGVCLGHQVIAQSFKGTVRRSKIPMHGKSSLIQHDATGLFEGLASPLQVGRYHSLSIEASSELEVNATSPDGEIMAIKHKDLPIWGVQFHPESILTHQGHDILKNFLKLAGVLT